MMIHVRRPTRRQQVAVAAPVALIDSMIDVLTNNGTHEARKIAIDTLRLMRGGRRMVVDRE